MREPAEQGHGEDLLVSLALAGRVALPDVQRRSGLPLDDLRRALEEATRAGDVETRPHPRGELFGLTAQGRARAAARFAADRALLGAALEAAYERFAPRNADFKDAVGRWQLRPVGGATVPNDHADPRWDERVLADLARSVRGVQTILEPLASLAPRYERYRERLGSALAAAGRGEARFVTGLEVDSLHSVWWELHADLLALLGRARTAADA